jgi:hypothetical protein
MPADLNRLWRRLSLIRKMTRELNAAREAFLAAAPDDAITTNCRAEPAVSLFWQWRTSC